MDKEKDRKDAYKHDVIMLLLQKHTDNVIQKFASVVENDDGNATSNAAGINASTVENITPGGGTMEATDGEGIDDVDGDDDNLLHR